MLVSFAIVNFVCLPVDEYFSVDDTPGTGTFYDFHKRLWLSDDKNLSDALHPPKDFYCGYDLYMLTASDSVNDLLVFPFLSPKVSRYVPKAAL